MTRVLMRALVAVLVVLGLGLSGLMCARVADRGRYAAPLSTYSAGPDGARAVYDLIASHGRPVQRWVEDLWALPPDGALVALGGCEAALHRPLSRYEAERLHEWVSAGGTLMVFGAHDYLPTDFPIRLQRASGVCGPPDLAEVLGELQRGAPSQSEPPAVEPPEPGGADPESADADAARLQEAESKELDPWYLATGADGEAVYGAVANEGPLSDLGGVPMSRPARLVRGDLRDNADVQVLAGFGGRDAVLALELGQGHVILVASASMLANERVLSQHGGVLISRLVDAYAPAGAPVVFDEYHLGTGGTRSLVRYLRQVGVSVVLLQLLFLGALWLLRSGRPLGELEEPASQPPGGTVSYVAATSALYARSADRGGVLRVLLVRALDRVATHQRIHARRPEQVVGQLRALGRHQAADATEALLQLFAEPVTSEKALLTLTQRVDILVARACAPDVLPALARPTPSPSPPTLEAPTS
ncbi:MAG: DUF4350 domain-containing protein [Sandaracinaceae bacterium]|nr:DUF4350 domain-containing protein [Sandaracinaceae bacterium]